MEVYQIQLLLAFLGYSPGALDGVWGQNTQAALRQFQREYGLTPDGVAGEDTQKTLRGAVAGTAEKCQKEGTFWEEIEYFTKEEFRCKCGGRYCDGFPAQMQETVVRIADAARRHFGKPGHVVSGLRCQQWNAHEGGVYNSQHMYGEAVDLRIEGVGAAELQAFVRTQPGHRYSYCINGSNVHFDMEKAVR